MLLAGIPRKVREVEAHGEILYTEIQKSHDSS
jgi:hypothetical protein